MRKRILVGFISFISVFPLTVFCSGGGSRSDYYAGLSEIPYHEGGDCGCSCTYSWINYLYNAGRAWINFDYEGVVNEIGEGVTDEDIWYFLFVYSDDNHSIVQTDISDKMWQEIGKSIIVFESPHMEGVNLTWSSSYDPVILAKAVHTGNDPSQPQTSYDVKDVQWYDNIGNFEPDKFYKLSDFGITKDYYFYSSTEKYRALAC